MFGKIDEYNSEKETFHNYVERTVHFFEANSIAEEKMKPVFLAACGAKTYETLKNLCLPLEVSDVDYGDIIDKLKTHFKPEPLIIYERYMFGKRSRKTDERIADFAVELKRLSASCKFGCFLDEALCMQFVVGLSMSKIQSRLMQESTLAFETAVKIAIAEHAAITSCAEIEPSTSRDSADRVHHVAATKHANPARVNKSSCWRCGNSNHTPDSCRFKTQTCHGCNKVGHIQKRCDAVRKWTRDKKTTRPVHYVTTEAARQMTTSSITCRRRHARRQVQQAPLSHHQRMQAV